MKQKKRVKENQIGGVTSAVAPSNGSSGGGTCIEASSSREENSIDEGEASDEWWRRRRRRRRRKWRRWWWWWLLFLLLFYYYFLFEDLDGHLIERFLELGTSQGKKFLFRVLFNHFCLQCSTFIVSLFFLTFKLLFVKQGVLLAYIYIRFTCLHAVSHVMLFFETINIQFTFDKKGNRFIWKEIVMKSCVLLKQWQMWAHILHVFVINFNVLKRCSGRQGSWSDCCLRCTQ